nr:hypothetical protein [Tanacetum cinerariifolium]
MELHQEGSSNKEILAFLRFLGHSGEIRKLTDVNINKLHQPWRSFVAIINKCLSGKSTGYNSLRLSQAQILWRLYHKKNVDFAYLLWEDFVYQVEHKDAKKSNEIYYLRNSEAYKEYYAVASGAVPPKTKATDDDDNQDEGNDDEQDSNEEGKEFIHPKLSIHDEEETKDEERFNPIAKTPESSDDEGNDHENLGLNVGREEGQDAEDDEDKLYRDSLSMSSQFVTGMLNPTPDAGIDSLFETISQMDVQAPTTVGSLTLSAPNLTPSTISTISTVPQAPTPPTTAQSTLMQDLPNFGSDIVTLKRRRDDDANKDEEPPAGADRTTSESAPAEEPMQTTHDLDEPSHQEFVTGVADDQPIAEASQHPEWFQQQKKPPTPDHKWNKTLSATHGSIQPWISELAKQADSRSSFNELMDTPSYVFDHFINNDLEYLRGGASSRKYTTSVTKTKTADYGHIRWIQDLVLRIMWSQEPNKDKQNRLMQIDELHKLSNGTLNDVRTALEDRLKGIRMNYLPQTIWRKSDKERAAVMIQAINKQLKTRRIMRSLKKLVGERLYEGDKSYEVVWYTK